MVHVRRPFSGHVDGRGAATGHEGRHDLGRHDPQAADLALPAKASNGVERRLRGIAIKQTARETVMSRAQAASGIPESDASDTSRPGKSLRMGHARPNEPNMLPAIAAARPRSCAGKASRQVTRRVAFNPLSSWVMTLFRSGDPMSHRLPTRPNEPPTGAGHDVMNGGTCRRNVAAVRTDWSSGQVGPGRDDLPGANAYRVGTPSR